jgi:hypothetical protein
MIICISQSGKEAYQAKGSNNVTLRIQMGASPAAFLGIYQIRTCFNMELDLNTCVLVEFMLIVRFRWDQYNSWAKRAVKVGFVLTIKLYSNEHCHSYPQNRVRSEHYLLSKACIFINSLCSSCSTAPIHRRLSADILCISIIFQISSKTSIHSFNLNISRKWEHRCSYYIELYVMRTYGVECTNVSSDIN